MSQAVLDSPQQGSSPIKDTRHNDFKLDSLKPSNANKKLNQSNDHDVDGGSGSPQKRLYLHSMSPNVTRKTIYLNHNPSLNEGKSKFPTLRAPIPNARSKSTIMMPSSAPHSPKHKLRRGNSLISLGGSSNSSDIQQQSSTTSSDRFIPSRHNSTTGKLESNIVEPHPNSSPQTHIKAQTSKIYQHHVAEACGLKMHSRILQFQPLPPERKRPFSLFNQTSSVNKKPNMDKSLTPAVAAARAKKIPTAPDRVLDAPGLIDDFYLNLLAWSLSNLLAIGLEDAAYVWNASTGSVGLLCELPNKTAVTSLKWSDDGSYISIGKDDGFIEIWDIEKNTKLRTLNCDNHQTRIASQSWYQHILTSGSRLGNMYFSDVRVSSHVVNKIENTHSAEICGIEYKANGQQFASGGNDNLVCIWDVRQCHTNYNNTNKNTTNALFTKTNHRAAVKALSWCPYQQSLLATGGGSSDKNIHFWNTSTGARVNTIETGSQISSLNWGYSSGTGMEIVATHGFPTNNISLFNYPTLQKTGEILSAHDSRILNGCLSPDKLTLATVAGDENLKFWSLFDLYKQHGRDGERIGDVDSQDDLRHNPKSIKKMMSFR